MPAVFSALITAATAATSSTSSLPEAAREIQTGFQHHLDFFRRCGGLLGADSGTHRFARVDEETGAGYELLRNRRTTGTENLFGKQRIDKFGRRFHDPIITHPQIAAANVSRDATF